MTKVQEKTKNRENKQPTQHSKQAQNSNKLEELCTSKQRIKVRNFCSTIHASCTTCYMSSCRLTSMHLYDGCGCIYSVVEGTYDAVNICLRLN
jgi:hypothetical protein